MTHQQALMLASATMGEIPGRLSAVVSPFSYYATALLHPPITSLPFFAHTLLKTWQCFVKNNYFSQVFHIQFLDKNSSPKGTTAK